MGNKKLKLKYANLRVIGGGEEGWGGELRVKGRGAPEQRMRRAEPLAGGLGTVEGPVGTGHDLGQAHQAVRLLGRERAGRAPTAEGAGRDAEHWGELRV